MAESPSLLLQRAAELIEQRAAEATDGPWRASGYEMYSVADDEVVEIGHEAGGFVRQEDAAWSAMLSPAVAAPLVAWLRDSAESVREHDADEVANGRKGEYCPNENQALEFARLVLGVSAEGKERSDP